MAETSTAYDTAVSVRDAAGRLSERSPVLRWWPAALLLVIMLSVRGVVGMMEAPGLPILMLGFMGPAGLGLLILGWWCFASRASAIEKLVGIAGFLTIAGLGIAFLHFSLQGMGVLIQVIPTGTAMFGIGMIALARSPRFRVAGALFLSVLGFGFWDLKQSEGVRGDFSAQLKWRWEPTAEEDYLRELADRKPVVNDGDGAAADSGEAVTLASAQWPAFRGADRAGDVAGVVLAEDWDASAPKEIWRAKIGPGWSSFSVAGNRLFTQEQRGDDEAVLCLDANTGNILWDYTYPARFWEAIAGAGPRATPTIADEGLFAFGAKGTLVCLNAATGEKRWERNLAKDAQREPPQWGFSSSPLVTDGLVIVHAGGDGDRGLFAYDAVTGDQVWSVPSGDHSYSSAQLATFDSVRGILMMTNDGLQFVKVETGETIWDYAWPGDNYRCLQPLVMGHSILIATSLGLGTRRITVALNDAGNWDITEDWTSRDMKPEFNDYVAFRGAIYGFDGNIFASIDAESGERNWKRGRYGNGQVVLLSESGQLLITSEKGEIVLLRATPDKLDEVAKFSAIEGKTWNHPVLIGNRIYLRNAEEVACFELPLASPSGPAEPANEATAEN